MNDGPHWKEQRTATLSILKQLGMGKNILAEDITQECQEYLKAIGEAEGNPQDIKGVTFISITNVICALALGQRYDYDDSRFKRIIGIMHHSFTTILSLKAMILNVWPVLHYVPGDFFNVKLMKDNRVELDQMILDFFKNGNSKSFIANYIIQQEIKENKGQNTSLDDKNLVKICEDLLGAGSDTTASTLMFFVLYMILYPDVQEKMFQEINTHIGTERTPTLADKKNLKYVNAAIFETQRMGNVVPIGIVHKASRDTWFKGYRIPKDTSVVGCLTSIMFDEEIWGPDVDSFRPERFLDDAGNLKSFGQHIPFCIGRRACPGEALAKMVMFIYVTSMCQRFKFLPEVDGQKPEVGEINSLTRCPTPYRVRVVDRRL